MGKESEKEWNIYIYVLLIHFVVHLKLKQLYTNKIYFKKNLLNKNQNQKPYTRLLFLSKCFFKACVISYQFSFFWSALLWSPGKIIHFPTRFSLLSENPQGQFQLCVFMRPLSKYALCMPRGLDSTLEMCIGIE